MLCKFTYGSAIARFYSVCVSEEFYALDWFIILSIHQLHQMHCLCLNSLNFYFNFLKAVRSKLSLHYDVFVSLFVFLYFFSFCFIYLERLFLGTTFLINFSKIRILCILGNFNILKSSSLSLLILCLWVFICYLCGSARTQYYIFSTLFIVIVSGFLPLF